MTEQMLMFVLACGAGLLAGKSLREKVALPSAEPAPHPGWKANGEHISMEGSNIFSFIEIIMH